MICNLYIFSRHTCVYVYSCCIGISVKRNKTAVRQHIYPTKKSQVKRIFKNKACSKNIMGTLNCQPALPRLQIRTHGLCWNQSKYFMTFFLFNIKNKTKYNIHNLLGCNFFISYLENQDWLCWVIVFVLTLLFLWYHVPRFLCNSFEVGLEMSPGYLHHPSQSTDMVGQIQVK